MLYKYSFFYPVQNPNEVERRLHKNDVLKIHFANIVGDLLPPLAPRGVDCEQLSYFLCCNRLSSFPFFLVTPCHVPSTKGRSVGGNFVETNFFFLKLPPPLPPLAVSVYLVSPCFIENHEFEGG